MRSLLLIFLAFLSLSVYSQQGEFEILEPITFTGLNEQLVADSIFFEKGDIVPYKESFGVLLIVKNGITIRTSYKTLKQLQDDAKIKILLEDEADFESMTSEIDQLRKINAKLNFLIGTTIVGIVAGAISIIRLFRTD